MSRPQAKLNEKHYEALRLIEEGNMSIKKIAQQLGWSADYLYDLYEGNVEKTSSVAILFKAEVDKIEKKNTDKIKFLTKDNKVLALRMMNEYLRAKSTLKTRSDDDLKKVVSIFNALSKITHNVEIGSIHSYTKGLTAEELVHEFNRLKTIANGASYSRRIQEIKQGRSRVLSELAESASGDGEESEDTDV